MMEESTKQKKSETPPEVKRQPTWKSIKRKPVDQICMVAGCDSNADIPEYGVGFHTFPNKALLCSQWVSLCGNPNLLGKYNLELSKRCFVCSKHFSGDSLTIVQGQICLRRKLRSVPTLNLPPPIKVKIYPPYQLGKNPPRKFTLIRDQSAPTPTLLHQPERRFIQLAETSKGTGNNASSGIPPNTFDGGSTNMMMNFWDQAKSWDRGSRCVVPGCSGQKKLGNVFGKNNRQTQDFMYELLKPYKPKNWIPALTDKICRDHYQNSSIVTCEKTGRRIFKQNCMPVYFPWAMKKSKKFQTKSSQIAHPNIEEMKEMEQELFQQRYTVSEQSLKKAFERLPQKRSKTMAEHLSMQTCCRSDVDYAVCKSMLINNNSIQLEQMRSAILQHRWNEVAKMLPTLINAPRLGREIYKILLQLFCHHPNSSPELLENFISVTLGKSGVVDSLSETILNPIFGTGSSEVRDPCKK